MVLDAYTEIVLLPFSRAYSLGYYTKFQKKCEEKTREWKGMWYLSLIMSIEKY
jgi:hypothetical protein